MDLSIVIVNWNSKEYVRKCIASIIAETKSIEFEIIVVDSGSFDGCETMLRDCYPEVRYIQRKENVGFARANNLAYNISSGKALLFLNPDTEIIGPAIDVIYAALQTLPNIGIIGVKLLNPDRTIQTSCIKAFPNLLNQVIDVEILQKIFPRAGVWGMRPLFDKTEAPAEVDVVSGACMAMSRSVFEKIGKFSTHYFMYAEDVDLCLKTRLEGLRNYYLPSAAIVHHNGACAAVTKKGSFANIMMVESRWRFFERTKSRWYARYYSVEIGLISVVRLVLALMLWFFNIGRRESTNKWGAALKKWWGRLRWTVGAESWVKNY